MARLGILTSQAIKAEVVIEASDEHRLERLYRVRLELTMPDGVVVVAFDHPSNAAHEDLYVAIRNAFRAARRQLESRSNTRLPSVVAAQESPGMLPRDVTLATNDPVIPAA
jgi:ribosome-associated translation inhibitor RaiA